MINVLHVVLNLHVGGLERFVIELMDKYSDNIVPHVVCLEEKGELAQFVKGNLICLGEKPGLKFGSALKIVKIIQKYNIEIVHTHNESAHLYGSLAGFISRTPVIHTRHGKYSHSSTRKQLLNVFSSWLTTKVVGVSEDVSKMMVMKEFVSTNKVSTVLNGVDVEAYLPRSKRNLFNCKNDCVKIGIVARLEPVKDHSNLLRACHELKKFSDDFVLIVVGDGTLRQQLSDEAAGLQIDDRVIFTGTRHDITDIVNELDIYVLSSISEGISLTLLEAMSCCLPVVATNVGGNPEVVKEGETGYLVPPRDPALFAEKLLCLIGDGEMRTDMGNAGRARVERFFNLSQTAKNYEKLYSELLRP